MEHPDFNKDIHSNAEAPVTIEVPAISDVQHLLHALEDIRTMIAIADARGFDYTEVLLNQPGSEKFAINADKDSGEYIKNLMVMLSDAGKMKTALFEAGLQITPEQLEEWRSKHE